MVFLTSGFPSAFLEKRLDLKRSQGWTKTEELECYTLWEGYSAAEATWEPVESFAGCKELLDAFEWGQA
jgi:hypothetical protein